MRQLLTIICGLRVCFWITAYTGGIVLTTAEQNQLGLRHTHFACMHTVLHTLLSKCSAPLSLICGYEMLTFLQYSSFYHTLSDTFSMWQSLDLYCMLFRLKICLTDCTQTCARGSSMSCLSNVSSSKADNQPIWYTLYLYFIQSQLCFWQGSYNLLCLWSVCHCSWFILQSSYNFSFDARASLLSLSLILRLTVMYFGRLHMLRGRRAIVSTLV